ncbi:precorrin-3B C(17)-methyltransferase, partial [Pseudomonas sp. SIMBA_059]
MAGMSMHKAPAIVVLGPGSLATAQRIQLCYPHASIHGLSGRVEGADQLYASFGDTLRTLYQQD